MKHSIKLIVLLCTVSLAFLAVGFALTRQTPPAAVLSPTSSIPTKQIYDYQYLAGVWQGNIAIFEPGNTESPKYISEIPLSTLTKHDAEIFKAGKKLYSDQEVTQLLEDFGS